MAWNGEEWYGKGGTLKIGGVATTHGIGDVKIKKLKERRETLVQQNSPRGKKKVIYSDIQMSVDLILDKGGQLPGIDDDTDIGAVEYDCTANGGIYFSGNCYIDGPDAAVGPDAKKAASATIEFLTSEDGYKIGNVKPA